jgi:hypothetical protein
VQRLHAALIPPAGARQDSEIFLALLSLAGEPDGAKNLAEIFASLAREIAAYKDLDFDSIGDQGVEVGSGGGGVS